MPHVTPYTILSSTLAVLHCIILQYIILENYIIIVIYASYVPCLFCQILQVRLHHIIYALLLISICKILRKTKIFLDGAVLDKRSIIKVILSSAQ